MKSGKITEPILKRSILKEIKRRREEIQIGAGIGIDSAVIKCEPEEYLFTTIDTKEINFSYAVKTTFYHAINDLAAAGAEPIGILISLSLPENYSEAKLKKIMQEIELECDKIGIEIAGGHTEVMTSIKYPILTVTGLGKAQKDNSIHTVFNIKPNQDIVMSKYIGIEGSIQLACKKRSVLLQRYSDIFLEQIEEWLPWLSVTEEAAVAVKHGAAAMHDIEETGIFGALWELAEGAGIGLMVDIKKIPVKQETIEICEYFDINPYEINSAGSLLMVTEKGEELVLKLKAAGIPAGVIGRTMVGNDRILINEEEKRYLEPMRKNESEKIWKEKELE